MLAFSMSAMAVTFNFDAEGTQTQTIDNITVKLEKGSGQNAPAYSSYNGMKIYANNTITIDAAEAFKNVQLVFSKNENKDYLKMSASAGELVSGGTSTALDDKKVDVWNGEETHLVFTMGTKGQRVLFQIVVDGDPIDLNPKDDPEPEELDSTYVYGEPTTILSPDTNFYKKEYSFIESNIRVSCTQGTILSNDTAMYFNCNAGYSLTFEATQPFKGLVINGYVRKQFSATVDKGDIDYCSPGALEEDREGYPVVIITNIDSTAVTIYCEKQLRCYSVYAYFEENPSDALDCGGESGEGEIINLTFDKADAVYESEISEEEGKVNYTIYLMTQANPEYPYLTLDLYPAAKGDLVGTYNMYDETLGETTWYQYGADALDRTWMYEDGAVAISKTGDVYTVAGYLDCDDNNTYNFSFTGEMPFYTDTEYYGEQEGIEKIPALDTQAEMYDILGRRVGKDYKGIVIQNNNKYLLR